MVCRLCTIKYFILVTMMSVSWPLLPYLPCFVQHQGRRPELPENTHPRLLDLMQRCWDTYPAVRPSFSEIEIELEDLLKLVQVRSVCTSQICYSLMVLPQNISSINRIGCSSRVLVKQVSKEEPFPMNQKSSCSMHKLNGILSCEQVMKALELH